MVPTVESNSQVGIASGPKRTCKGSETTTPERSPEFGLDVVRTICLMGELSPIVLRPVVQRDHWRVEMVWLGHNARYFGQFHSRTEAEKWIEEHRWLAKQSQESR
jgi:hypothetical protein